MKAETLTQDLSPANMDRLVEIAVQLRLDPMLARHTQELEAAMRELLPAEVAQGIMEAMESACTYAWTLAETSLLTRLAAELRTGRLQ